MQQFINNIVNNDFLTFLQRVFITLHPGQNLDYNWHLELLSETIKEVETSGTIQRIIVSLPPRSLKSICFSVAWPAWILGHDPRKKVIVASYSQSLANKHSHDCRMIMKSDWYKVAFPETKLLRGQNKVNKFMTTKHGFRLATSVGGMMTGEGADVIVVDDPHTPIQAMSKTMRERSANWFRQTLMSRLNNKKKGVIVVVMQRMHSQDLAGVLLDSCGSESLNHWHNIKIPMIAGKSIDYKIGRFRHCFVEGECMHKNRDDMEDIEKLRHEVGSYVFAAQYQQEPMQAGGGIIKKSWIQRYGNLRKMGGLKWEAIYQSWDCAIKAIAGKHDYSVCSTWGLYDGRLYLLHIFREQLEYPYLYKAMADMARRYNPHAVLIEDKAAGQQLLQDLAERSNKGDRADVGNAMVNSDGKSKGAEVTNGMINEVVNCDNGGVGMAKKAANKSKAEKAEKEEVSMVEKTEIMRTNTDSNGEVIIPAVAVMPRYDKVTRLMLVSPLFEAGKVLLPEHADWLPTFENELFLFPETLHDDQVDSVTQMLWWWQNKDRECSKGKGAAVNKGKKKKIVQASITDANGWGMRGL